jgi:alpha-tubulin suppressor-like RCC1 family protein
VARYGAQATLHKTRVLRFWAIVAASSALAVALTMSSGPNQAQGTGAKAVAPGVQPLAAPSVLQKAGKVELQSRKDYRSVDTGIGVFDNTAYVWGFASDGISGGDGWKAKDPEAHEFPPTPVEGLPKGVIVDVAAGIYNMNAMDVQGCIWGWGAIGWHDGSGNRLYSFPPVKIRIGGEWKNTSKPELCGAQVLSRTEQAGAAITKDGVVYSWGHSLFGGPGPNSAANKVGAKQVSGLPDPSIEGNRPVALEGGYSNFWLILENGEVWYFGHDAALAGVWHHERPGGDENSGYSGGRTGAQIDAGAPQVAKPSKGLSPWFRANSPDEYIVQVHSGIAFGAALLSTGRVLSWGPDPTVGAIGRQCTGSVAQMAACARKPGLVDFGSTKPKIVSVSCSFTACAVLSADGELYAWGKPERSYEGLPDHRPVTYDPKHLGAAVLPQVSSFGGGGSVVRLAKNVTDFQAGQGYFIWHLENGQYWGRGYNSLGQLGHKAGNYGAYPGFFNESLTRPVWFSKSYYRGCWSVDQTSPIYDSPSKWPGDQIMFRSVSHVFLGDGKSYNCADLNQKNSSGGWKNRFTLDECLAGKCGL